MKSQSFPSKTKSPAAPFGAFKKQGDGEEWFGEEEEEDSRGMAKKFRLSDVRRLICFGSDVEVVGVSAVGENPSSCRAGSSPLHSRSASSSSFVPQRAPGSWEVLSWEFQMSVGTSPPNPHSAKLTFKRKTYDF